MTLSPHLRANSPRADVQRGFTLLEVLVALAVVAIALGAMIRLMGDSAGAVDRLEQRLFGHWVAMNQLAEVEATQEWLDLGEKSGKEVMAGRTWRWQRTVKKTGDDRIRWVEVSVSTADERPVAVLVGFIGNRK